MFGDEVVSRFWRKVQIGTGADDCWMWLASRDKRGGYGQFYPRHGHLVKAHRFAMILAVGSIPPGMYVCHRCDNPGCVNPHHLFIGSPSDNRRDTQRKGRWHNQNTGVTTCIHGHPLSGRNVYLTKRGRRACKECGRLRVNASNAAKRLQPSSQSSTSLRRKDVRGEVVS